MGSSTVVGRLIENESHRSVQKLGSGCKKQKTNTPQEHEHDRLTGRLAGFVDREPKLVFSAVFFVVVTGYCRPKPTPLLSVFAFRNATETETHIEKPILGANPRLEAPLPPSFLRTMFRNAATTPASPLIRTFTTPRLTFPCPHYTVAKRQQFSCPPGTATLLLKLKNVVLGLVGFVLSRTVAKHFLYWSSIDEHYSYIQVRKSLAM